MHVPTPQPVPSACPLKTLDESGVGYNPTEWEEGKKEGRGRGEGKRKGEAGKERNENNSIMWELFMYHTI